MKDALGIVIMFTVIGIGLAALFLFCARKATAYRRWTLLILTAVFGCLGLLSLLSYVIDSAKLFALSLSLWLSGLSLPTAIMQLIQYKLCTVPIRAKLKDKKISRVRHSSLWIPIFSYTYEGKTIVSESCVSYSPRKFSKLFEVGNTYDIYINPKFPTDCADKRKFPSGAVVLLAVGIVILLFGIYILCLPSDAITIK